MLRRLFRLDEHGSSVRVELLGGLTTFLTMAYIVVVNPAILAFAGIPEGPSTMATALAAALGTLLMALVARRPFAVAPYMGENAFLAFGLAALGITGQQRLGAVFVAGALFLAITWVGWRQKLAAAIPSDLKPAFAVAIGLFLAELGLYQCGVFTSFAAGMPAAALAGDGGLLRAPDVPVKLGDWSQPATLLALAGILLTFVLVLRRVRGAILLGMLPTAAAGFALGLGERPASWLAMPFTGDFSLAPIALELDVAGVLAPALWPVLGTLALMGFLDSLVAARSSADTPAGQALGWEIPSTSLAAALWLLLTFVRITVGTLFFTLVAQSAVDGKINWKIAFYQLPRASLQICLLAITCFFLVLAAFLPFKLLAGYSYGESRD